MKFKYFYESTTSPFAVFVLAPFKDGWAATRRAADRGEIGRIGLPGGKVDPGEDPVSAAIRESEEEGWKVINVNPKPIHQSIVDGRTVWWFKAESSKPLKEYKEKSRGIKPIKVSLDKIASSGYGNEFILDYKNNLSEETWNKFNESSQLPQDEPTLKIWKKYGWDRGEGLEIEKGLNLSNTPITQLPAGLKVGGTLNLSDTPITQLPDDLQVAKLSAPNSSITQLPDDLQVVSLYLTNTPLTHLPAGLEVVEDLLLSGCTQLKQLPAGLKVGGNLYLSKTNITELPADLQVGGEIKGFIDFDEGSTNFNKLEDPEYVASLNKAQINKIKNLKSYKKWYLHPKMEAQKYNNNIGIFLHSTDSSSVWQLIENPTNIEMCVSTLDSNTTFKNETILIGRGDIRLLFDFDCYSYVNKETGKRYATNKSEEIGKISHDDLDKSKSERIKSGLGVEHIGEKYYDEGFISPQDVDWLFITGTYFENNESWRIEDAENKLGLKYIPLDLFNKIVKNGRLDILYDYIHSKNDDDDEDEYDDYEAPVRGKRSKMVAGEDHLLESFEVNTMTAEQLDQMYNIMKSSYEGAIGTSWSKDKFIQRSANWVFYGDEEGFVAIRPQQSGPYKLVATAGKPLSILRGFKELSSSGKPIWGMVSKDIQSMLHKKGFKTPPAFVTKKIAKTIPPKVFGGVDAEINKDGSITIDYPDVGKATKYFVGNSEYFKWAIDNIPDNKLPKMVKILIKKLV